jgi:hypothetical protein
VAATAELSSPIVGCPIAYILKVSKMKDASSAQYMMILWLCRLPAEWPPQRCSMVFAPSQTKQNLMLAMIAVSSANRSRVVQ